MPLDRTAEESSAKIDLAPQINPNIFEHNNRTFKLIKESPATGRNRFRIVIELGHGGKITWWFMPTRLSLDETTIDWADISAIPSWLIDGLTVPADNPKPEDPQTIHISAKAVRTVMADVLTSIN